MISSVADISIRSRCLAEFLRRQEVYLFRFVRTVLNSRTQRGVSSGGKNNRRRRNYNDTQAMVTLSVDDVHWRVTFIVFLLSFGVLVSSTEGLLPFSVPHN